VLSSDDHCAALARPFRSRWDREFESPLLQRGVNCSLHHGAASLFIEQELSPKRVQALLLSLRADKGLYRSVVQIWG